MASQLDGLNSRYLRVQDLRRLKNLFFSSRRVVEGQYAGRHSSPQRGHSVEFSDYRQYMPGDEVADVDWKVYGRSDRLYVKLFEHQSDMTVNLLVDASASMGYAGLDGGGISKFDHACRMAAAVAFLTTRQQDKVSFGLSQDGLKAFHRPHGSFVHLREILDAMEQARPRGEAKLAHALRSMAGRIGRRGLLVVFSDLLEDPEAILNAVSIFSHHGSEVIVFHVLHADEQHLPEMGDALFQDSESGERIALNVDDVRGAYERRLRQFLGTWETAFRGRGIDYHRVSTATEYVRALEGYLYQRASLA